MPNLSKKIKKLPESPGVYIFKNAKKAILYVGKAVNLKRRVSSYFAKSHDNRITAMINETADINYLPANSALEALVLEARLIKKFYPPYNIKDKDDRSFLFVEFTKEKFPRLLLVRGKTKSSGARYGPFIYGSSIREALRILRKIFPWSLHSEEWLEKSKKPCFDYEIGLCPGTCFGAISRQEYLKNISRLKMFFEGKTGKLIKSLEAEMRKTSHALEFEKAARLRKQIFALKHVQDVAILGKAGNEELYLADSNMKRIEGYDVSNISGVFAVGAMVVFENNRPNKNQYRKFKIYSVIKPNDTGMLEEVLNRRLAHSEWAMPDILLIDGGRGQVNVAERVLSEFGLKIPVIGIAKGSERKRNDFYGSVPEWTDETTLIKVRNEAHRFAISYHKKLRDKI